MDSNWTPSPQSSLCCQVSLHPCPHLTHRETNCALLHYIYHPYKDALPVRSHHRHRWWWQKGLGITNKVLFVISAELQQSFRIGSVIVLRDILNDTKETKYCFFNVTKESKYCLFNVTKESKYCFFNVTKETKYCFFHVIKETKYCFFHVTKESKYCFFNVTKESKYCFFNVTK